MKWPRKAAKSSTKHQHAVVTVQVVLKISGAGRSSESRQDLTGTVVDPSGLTVLALSACDPSEMYQRMMSEAASTYKLDIEVTDIKMLLDDGTEIPSEIVLRDKDLDLAFIRPKTKPSSPMPAIDLSKSASAQILDQVITLNRLNSAAGRAYAASVERITAVIQKPRTFYIPDSTMTATTLGSPAFTLDGNIVGVFVMRAIGAQGGGSRNYRDTMTTYYPARRGYPEGGQTGPRSQRRRGKEGSSQRRQVSVSRPARSRSAASVAANNAPGRKIRPPRLPAPQSASAPPRRSNGSQSCRPGCHPS